VAEEGAGPSSQKAWSGGAPPHRRRTSSSTPVTATEMPRSAPVDGFALAYDRGGAGDPVVLLHGWPGDRTDFEALVPLLSDRAELVVPDLRGFGASDKHPAPPAEAYSAAAQARSILGLLDELGLAAPVLAGYDIGSRIAQAAARAAPERVRALVISPPLPGAGDRVLTAGAQREFWYQPFHALGLVEELLDGRPDAVRAYLGHFWSHWSGPSFEPDDRRLDHLAEVYGPPGAMTASVAWYRAGSGMVAMSLAERAPTPEDRIAVPTTILWPEHDPLFPPAWSDRLDAFFAAVEVEHLAGAGHFTPVEAPEAFAAAIRRALG
jgi:pimeloyl-ACP methyl ester carboxylesterase